MKTLFQPTNAVASKHSLFKIYNRVVMKKIASSSSNNSFDFVMCSLTQSLWAVNCQGSACTIFLWTYEHLDPCNRKMEQDPSVPNFCSPFGVYKDQTKLFPSILVSQYFIPNNSMDILKSGLGVFILFEF